MSTSLNFRNPLTPRRFSAPQLPKAIAIAAPSPRFSGKEKMIVLPVKSFLESLDFTKLGIAPVKQTGLVFSALIGWRLLAANDRRLHSESKRWNELRENLMRDLLGFGFWFLGVPVIQRLYLAAVAQKNPALKNVLIQNVQQLKSKQTGNIFQQAKHWIGANNPIDNRYIPSTQQVADQKVQMLAELKKADIGSEHAVYQQTERYFQQLTKHRNFATAIGLGATIVSLGVGINLLNFYLTRKNVVKNVVSNPSKFTPSLPLQFPVQSVLPQAHPTSFAAANPFQTSFSPFVAPQPLFIQQAFPPTFPPNRSLI